MTPDSAELVHVRIPLHEPFAISTASVAEKDGLLVRLRGGGLEAWGESSPMAGGFYGPETPEDAWDFLSGVLLPGALKEADWTVAGINAFLDRFPGHPFAKAGLENAVWDWQARRAGLPVCALLGGSPKPVPSGLAVGIYDRVEILVSRVEGFLAAGGYRRVKVKIRPGWDAGPLEALRTRFGDGLRLWADANAAYTPERIPHLESLDRFRLEMIEQPMGKDDLEGSARLQAEISTPVCLDESLETLAQAERAIALKAFRIANLKIQRVGGLARAKAMLDLCRSRGIPAWVGTMPELGVGSAFAVHLATLPGIAFPTDVEASSRWFVDDVAPIGVRAGEIACPAAPGIGFPVDGEAVARHALRRMELRP